MFDWVFTPAKRRFPPEHPFFEEGNVYCSILLKQLNLQEDVEDLISSAGPAFKCEVSDCNEYFHSIADYEVHYHSLHRNSCSSCHRAFPSNHLLDIHITENHDPLFQTLATRSKFMFRCLVESCPDKFSTAKERKDHLIKIHKYPSDFRFNRPSRKKKRAGKIVETKLPAADNEEMDVDKRLGNDTGRPECEQLSSVLTQPKPRQLPKTICFGRGSARSFQKHNYTNRNRKFGKRTGKSSYKLEESISMQE